MKNLTKNQLQAIYELDDHPLINETKIQHSNGMTRITIESVIGADWNEVDLLIDSELDYIFTDLEYMGSPAKHTNSFTGIDEEIYYINWNGETLIWLIMQLRVAEKEAV